MTWRHEQVVEKLKEMHCGRRETVALSIFGSLAKGTATAASDIDFEVISSAAKAWTLEHQEVDAITVDLVICPLDQFKAQIEDLPYLCYDLLTQRVLWDPRGVMGTAQERIRLYFESHQEVAAYWEENLRAMAERKRKGTHRLAEIIAAYDEAERRFSPNGQVRRKFLRGA